MKLKTAHFLLPKQNCKPSDCEDGLTINNRTLRYCVTDGASEAFDSRKWARLLAGMWKLSQPSECFNLAVLESKIKTQAIKWKKKWLGKELPWYSEEKSKKGSFAALVGLEIECLADGFKWRALALGDCCLFVQNQRGFISFPIVAADQFGTCPTLISTDTSDPRMLIENIKFQEGQINEDDILLLMSDALANWFLKNLGSNPHKIQELIVILKNNERDLFRNLVERERNAEDLRNDDIAVIAIFKTTE